MHPDDIFLFFFVSSTIICKLAMRFDFTCSTIHVSIISIHKWFDIVAVHVHGAKSFWVSVMTNNLRSTYE